MPTKRARGVNFCFTVNNYGQDDVTKLQEEDWISYCCVGKEVGESGTPHLQGYLQMKRGEKSKTIYTEINIAKRLEKVLGQRPHVELAKGTVEQNKTYCAKQAEEEDDDKFSEWGEARGRKSQGVRTDINDFLQAAMSGKDDVELATEYPTEFAKYHKAAEKARKAFKAKAAGDKMKAKFKGAELRDWQEKLVKQVDAQNDRQVTWVIDPVGGKGKSWLANWLYANKDAFIVDCGKQADIAHAYDCQEWVVFDLTRSQEERVNYQVIECFKNGRIFSPKYDSTMKIFEPAKVLVFANWAPEMEALSADRWDIVDMEAEQDQEKYIREVLRKPMPWGVYAESAAAETEESMH